MNLAQSFVDHGPLRADGYVRTSDATLLRAMYNVVHARLTGGPCFDGRPQALAERFVFAEDAPAVLGEFVKAGSLAWETIFECARDPAGIYWLEWPESGGGRLGSLVDTTMFDGEEMSTGLIFCARPKSVPPHPVPLCGVKMPPLPWPSSGSGMRAFFGRPEWIKPCVDKVLDALFLLNTPRTCAIKTITAAPALRKARARRGQGPLIDFKQVRLLIGEGARRYTKASDAAQQPGENIEQHRNRLHEVMGHWRTYRKSRDIPHSVYVAPHWRGDAKLGIIVHDRAVHRKAGVSPRGPERS